MRCAEGIVASADSGPTAGERLPEITLAFALNGRPCTVAVEPGAVLLDVLRNDLGLTGTKRGCGEGECGACTVLVDGRVVNSCLYPAMKVAGRSVLTVEGLGSAGDLHPLQETFLSHGAVQCGFCTPGMLLAAKALLDGNPEPTEEEIRWALSGNLCRCTGYTKIVAAVQAAAARLCAGGESAVEIEPAVGLSDPHVAAGHVGTSVTRTDGLAKVLGLAKYADDLQFEGMLHAKVVRSPHPHARIKAIDATAALRLPGVEAVVTAKDIPGRNSFGIVVKDQPFLASDTVRYIGEAVAAVAARSKAVAERALELIEVDYETLPAVFDPDEAMEEGAPQLFEQGNVRLHRHVERGDVDTAFARADIVVQDSFRTQLVEHAYIEPEAGIAVPDTNGLTLYVVSQGVHYQRSELAAMLNWPVSRIRVVQTAVGGAFGGKIDLNVHPFIALLAVKTGMPVKLVYTREESMTVSTKRHPFQIRMRFAANSEGRFIAAETRVIGDTGAYSSYGPAVLTRAATHAFGPYYIPNVRVDTYAVHTNNPIAGAMRGFGVPQMTTAYEQMVDMVAEKAGLSPLEIRLRNGLEPDLAITVTGHEISSELSYLNTLKAATDGFEFGAPS
jgi:aerobic-type carbon monoxide dehydrogenase small subunit (CoxS/CutS family)